MAKRDRHIVVISKITAKTKSQFPKQFVTS